MNLSRRITFFIIAALLLCSASIGTFAYILERNEVTKANAQRALAITRSVSAIVDSVQFAEIMSTLEPNEYHDTFRETLSEIMRGSDILYLYVLDAEYDDEVVYFAEGYPETSYDEPEILLGETDLAEYYAEEMFETISTGADTITGMYNLGDYGDMVSAFSAVKDASGRVIGVVGVDLSVNSAMSAARSFGRMMIVICLVFCAAATPVILAFVKKYMSTPITEMTDAAEKLAQGNTGISVTKRRDDEIGMLAVSFTHMIEANREQARLIERLAGGDLTVDVHPRSAEDTVGNSLLKLCTNLNGMMSGIQTSLNQVTIGSRQIADGAQSVAQGSSEQTVSIEALSARVALLSRSIEENAGKAARAASLSGEVKRGAETGNKQMEQMLLAVKEINDASLSIQRVIKVIDDIAFQTNILALNAAVEAARAGQHGKGFAVVADEVRSLAAKSAEAAKDTSGLITNSMEKAALGAKIAEQTSASLRGIVEEIVRSTELTTEIAHSGEEQAEAVNEIRTSVSQVSAVVQSNSAAAQQSAAASEQVSEQANMLGELVSQFRISDTAHLSRRSLTGGTRRL